MLRIEQLAGVSVMGTLLAEPDGTLTKRGYWVYFAAISTVACFLMYKLSRVYTPWFSKTYSRLSREDQRNWDTRYSSNVHAVVCVYYGYLMLWQSDFFYKDDPVPVILRSNYTTYTLLGLSFGYFVVDFFCCLKYMLGGMEMQIHHFMALFAVTTASVTGHGHLYTLWMLITEFTTPLINNRWWLDKMEMKSSKMYALNGLGIVLTWFFARLCLFPPFYVMLYSHRGDIKYIGFLSKFLVVVVPLILTFLNLFWFTKIIKGAYKVFFGPKKQVKQE